MNLKFFYKNNSYLHEINAYLIIIKVNFNVCAADRVTIAWYILR